MRSRCIARRGLIASADTVSSARLARAFRAISQLGRKCVRQVSGSGTVDSRDSCRHSAGDDDLR